MLHIVLYHKHTVYLIYHPNRTDCCCKICPLQYDSSNPQQIILHQWHMYVFTKCSLNSFFLKMNAYRLQTSQNLLDWNIKHFHPQGSQEIQRGVMGFVRDVCKLVPHIIFSPMSCDDGMIYMLYSTNIHGYGLSLYTDIHKCENDKVSHCVCDIESMFTEIKSSTNLMGKPYSCNIIIKLS